MRFKSVSELNLTNTQIFQGKRVKCQSREIPLLSFNVGHLCLLFELVTLMNLEAGGFTLICK